MKVDMVLIKKIKISEITGLGPISAVLEDIKPGHGQVIIECLGRSWSASWNGMGDVGIAKFFCGCDEDYLVGKLSAIKPEVVDMTGLLGLSKKRIIERRREGELSAEDARGLFDDSVVADDPYIRPAFMVSVFGDEWWHSIPMMDNPEYTYLCKIIGVLQLALRSEIAPPTIAGIELESA